MGACYDAKIFTDTLSSDLDYINAVYQDAIIIVAGDFSQLNTGFLQNDHGLVQLVNSPTHCDHHIDKVFVSHPDIQGGPRKVKPTFIF